MAKTRRLIETEKFFLFDVGVSNYLARRQPRLGSGIRQIIDLSGLRALRQEHRVRRSIVVSLERQPRTMDARIEVLTWETFLRQLWNGDLGV